MGTVYLRVEAVNLGNSVYDTNDISTIRGGSFMLLDAVNNLGKSFKNDLRKISTGASAGIFHVCSQKSSKDIKTEVADHLKKVTEGHATFVVNVFERNGQSFKEVQENLIAQNRWLQMQQLTVPWGSGWKGAYEPCSVNGVRSGADQDSGEPICESVKFRKNKGRPLRNRIYQEILGNSRNIPEFTNDLESLGKFPQNANLSHLDGKIAFIYFDGNKFSKIRNHHCSDETLLAEFDEAVQVKFRKLLLEDVVKHMEEDENALTSDKRVRLETLLWGGDEVEWIVPAWKAWDVLQLVYEAKPFYNSVPLTHAAGVVFCHYNAPILQIRKLAHALAELAKDNLSPKMKDRGEDFPQSHELGDTFHYLVLESFDMLEGSIHAFLENYYQPASFDSLLLEGNELSTLSQNMITLKKNFPRGKIHEIIAAFIKDRDLSLMKAIEDRALSEIKPDQREIVKEAISNLVDENPDRWFVIADLWDYVTEVHR